jgi:hypothetical protein
VRRGYLGRAWLMDFLEEIGFPSPVVSPNRLCISRRERKRVGYNCSTAPALKYPQPQHGGMLMLLRVQP